MNINIFELGAVLLAGVFFAIIYFLGKVKKYDFGLLTILGLVFGVAVGLIFKGHYLYLEAIGTIYLSDRYPAIIIQYYFKYYKFRNIDQIKENKCQSDNIFIIKHPTS